MSESEHASTSTLRRENTIRQRRLRLLRAGLILPGILGLVAFGIWRWATAPPSGEQHPITITISHGTGGLAIGRLLQDKGVIRSAYAFVLEIRLNGAGRELKAGRYVLATDMPLHQILDALEKGPSLGAEGIRITIPEGYTLSQIADLMEAKGITDGAALRSMATDTQAIASLHADFALPEKTLEGYLFPDTYTFEPHTPPAKVLEVLLTNFGARFFRPYQQEVQSTGHSLNEIITIASLIEREAMIPADRTRIAGVIENRLKRRMRLEIDATVIYALGYHKSRVLYKDLNVKSSYNTYRHVGLPPGPIANPGLPCLQAALHPEQNDYLYYVARPTGAHIFTRTAAEHASAIRQARSERRRKSVHDGL